jgi:hypothetical protein
VLGCRRAPSFDRRRSGTASGLPTMATEAYVKQHKIEQTIEDMLNSLKSQPGNPYTAMVRLAA